MGCAERQHLYYDQDGGSSASTGRCRSSVLLTGHLGGASILITVAAGETTIRKRWRLAVPYETSRVIQPNGSCCIAARGRPSRGGNEGRPRRPVSRSTSPGKAGSVEAQLQREELAQYPRGRSAPSVSLSHELASRSPASSSTLKPVAQHARTPPHPAEMRHFADIAGAESRAAEIIQLCLPCCAVVRSCSSPPCK